jgi:hypothetical protein
MTLAEWGNPTASFSYCLMRLSTVEIRAGCQLWVRAQAEPAPGKGKGHSPHRGRQESGSSAEKTLHADPRPFHLRKNYGHAGALFPVRFAF